MKPRIPRGLTAGLVAATLAVGLAGCSGGTITGPDEAVPNEAVPTEAVPTESGPDASAWSVQIPVDAWPMTVEYVHDGDTVFVAEPGASSRQEQTKTRLIGLDTPEVGEFEECFGPEAREFVRELLPEGQRVLVAEDAEPFDHFNRRLLYLWLEDGTFINGTIVREGFAEALRVRPNDAYFPQLRLAEAAARDENLAMWAACPAR